LNTKAKGNRNEYKSMKFLEKLGGKCLRSAASLGEWDIIALTANNVYLVQVKSNRKPPLLEMRAMKKFKGIRCSKCGNLITKKELHQWNDYARTPIITEIGEPDD
jgi:Holliday junction resolvase-like predicted endonuclease